MMLCTTDCTYQIQIAAENGWNQNVISDAGEWEWGGGVGVGGVGGGGCGGGGGVGNGGEASAWTLPGVANVAARSYGAPHSVAL